MRRAAIGLAAAAFAGLVVAQILRLPDPVADLPARVREHMPASGVEHRVTAVLLNFRGYDTLLEIGVLLLAAVIVLAVRPEGRANEPAAPASFSEAPTEMFARIVAGPITLVAVYLLWAGAYQPGGAFQAGAVLAAAAVLLHLAGVTGNRPKPRSALRAGMAGGFLLFLGVAAALLVRGALLEYPPQHAGALILLIEAGLTPSLGLILASLFLFLAAERP